MTKQLTRRNTLRYLMQRGKPPFWMPVLSTVFLVAACETPQEREVRERQEKYTQFTGLPAGAVVSVIQKGYSEGNAKFWVYYYSDRITEAQLAKTPAILCRERRQSDVKSAEGEPTSKQLQKAQPTLKKLFVRCIN